MHNVPVQIVLFSLSETSAAKYCHALLVRAAIGNSNEQFGFDCIGLFRLHGGLALR